jgi:hypothetical protein
MGSNQVGSSLACKYLTKVEVIDSENALAYYDAELIALVKRLTVQVSLVATL